MPDRLLVLLVLGAALAVPARVGARTEGAPDPLVRRCRPGQVEVGGPFVGVELHDGSLQPNRISLFYPVANSIDESRDYWTRGRCPVLELGLRVGGGPKRPLGDPGCECRLTPFGATMTRVDAVSRVEASYRFCRTSPAMVLTLAVTNRSARAEPFELFTRLVTSVKTSHTFALCEEARTGYDPAACAVYTSFERPDTGRAQLFVANAGERPESFTTRRDRAGGWFTTEGPLAGELIGSRPSPPVAAFTYRKLLAPGQTMTVVQLIGSARAGEAPAIVKRLLPTWAGEVAAYERGVTQRAFEGTLATGMASLDRTTPWARAILAANAHHLDGDLVPMPCPAQYNFWFAHDVMLTDLARVFFDLDTVRRDLAYVARRSDPRGTIPHAYYWKNDRFATEFAGKDNWNHFWVNLVAARYLRHGGDRALVARLYPTLLKSLAAALANESDGVIHGDRPDWWDFGKNSGPRAYLTILAIRSLEELSYVSTVIGRATDAELGRLEARARRLARGLDGLWDDRTRFLMNRLADGSQDPHLYIGSLLAAHFGLLSPGRLAALVDTAGHELLSRGIGIFNAVPMDFERLERGLGFARNEEGAPFHYMNGGIWPHGNAWYALALQAAGRGAEALGFVETAMTLDGVERGPHGQPAMYECRNGNPDDPARYGKVDKPQFLWAAAWYLYTVYHLLGARENAWNLSFEPPVPGRARERSFSICLGGRPVLVTLSGTGPGFREIRVDGRPARSAVVPGDRPPLSSVEIALGSPDRAYLAATQAVLVSADLEPGRPGHGVLSCVVRAFPGHANTTTVVCPSRPVRVSVDGRAVDPGPGIRPRWGGWEVEVTFVHGAAAAVLAVEY